MKSNVGKTGISMVALVITIIVLIILTSAVVITGVGAPKQAQLAVFNNNIDTVQELVSIQMGDNMIAAALYGYGDNYRWVDIVDGCNNENWSTNGVITFEPLLIGLDKNVARISTTLLEKTSLPETEIDKYYVDNNGVVYYEGFVYEGQTLYTKGTNNTPVVNPTDGSYNAKKGVNSPKLMTGMKAVYWEGNEEITSDDPNFDYNNWYDYVAQIGTTENGGTSHWANAKTEDGSSWVWIPRYAYSITSGYHTSTAGEIEIEFLKEKTNEGVSGRTNWDNISGQGNWNVHPAFSFEGIELAGIWVAKYEMSMETRVTSEEEWTYQNTGSASIGNKVIDNTTKETMRAVSKPGVSSWRNITIGNSFTNGLAYNSEYESHLMKNSEWGAVAYLAHSKYGRNGTEIAINGNTGHYTGGNNGAIALTNKNQSTTGNEYGIYDLSGGAWERVAGHLQGMQNTNIYGGVIADGEAKYKDVYVAYEDLIYGDAVYETSSSSSDNTSWYNDCSVFANSSRPFLARGGGYGSGRSAGMFTFNVTDSADFSNSWRVVLW